MAFSTQKNRINPSFLMFLLGENSLLNSWYEINPFTFHSQEMLEPLFSGNPRYF